MVVGASASQSIGLDAVPSSKRNKDFIKTLFVASLFGAQLKEMKIWMKLANSLNEFLNNALNDIPPTL